MPYKIKIKTGFYKTTIFNLSMLPEFIYLIPSEEEIHERIKIIRDDIIVITLIKKKQPLLEIQTMNQIFTGIFCGDTDYEELLCQFRENIGKKFFCE